MIIGTALEIGSVYVNLCLRKSFKESDRRTTWTSHYSIV